MYVIFVGYMVVMFSLTYSTPPPEEKWLETLNNFMGLLRLKKYSLAVPILPHSLLQVLNIMP